MKQASLTMLAFAYPSPTFLCHPLAVVPCFRLPLPLSLQPFADLFEHSSSSFPNLHMLAHSLVSHNIYLLYLFRRLLGYPQIPPYKGTSNLLFQLSL